MTKQNKEENNKIIKMFESKFNCYIPYINHVKHENVLDVFKNFIKYHLKQKDKEKEEALKKQKECINRKIRDQSIDITFD